MNNKFDELTKSLAQSVTRRAALRTFGFGLAAAIAASLGIKSAAAAPKRLQGYCAVYRNPLDGFSSYTGLCVDPNTCQMVTSPYCSGKISQAHVRGLVNNPCINDPIFALMDPKQACSL